MALGTQSDDDDVISAINVTPLVDIILVLLIIFMVTATYIVSNSIPIDLPEASTGEEVTSTVVVSIDEQGSLFLDGQAVDDDELLASLRRAKASNSEIRAIISADRSIRHSRFVQAVDIVRRAGIPRFAIDIQNRQNEGDDDDLIARIQ